MKILKENLHHSKLIATAIFVSAFFISCKKEKVNKTESAPISAAFFNSNFSVGKYLITSYEMGMLFSVAKNGKILKLGTKIPKAGSYRVTLWDDATKLQLAQVTVNQINDEVVAFSPLATPVAVTTGKTYLVTLWTPDTYYEATPVGGGNISYPLTSGNIVINGFRIKQVAKDPITCPTSGASNLVTGFADIEFQAD